jgi:hypothetical protein
MGLACLWVVCLVVLAGCQSTSPTGATVIASTTITGQGLSEIRMATLEAFQKAGYTVASAFGRELVFERRAGNMTDFAYGSWMDPAVWLRVKVRIEEIKPDVNVLDCSAFRVQNHGDSVLEEENRAYGMKSKPFKELLAGIKAKLDAAPRPSSK